MVKRNISVTEDKREKLRWLLDTNNENPHDYSHLFTSLDDVVGELLRSYEEVKGPITDPKRQKGRLGFQKAVKIIGAEGLP